MTDHVLGQRLRKIEGNAKATGRAIYTDDIALPRMLHAKILRSPHAHARILHVDTREAEALPGVHACLVGAELPIRYGIIPWTPDEQALAADKARYVGDGIAAVAAVDEDTANLALKKIRVHYEILEPLLDPEEAARRQDLVIHDWDPKKRGKGNITKQVDLSFGDVDGEMAASEIHLDAEFFFEGTTHTAIEPHCAVASFDEAGRLTVWSSTQVPHYLHRELAKVLELPPSMIRVIQPALGGAFGGKSEPFDLEFVTAKLSMKTGRPVKVLYTREEVFYSHRGRHPMKMRFETGADKDGKLKAVRSKILIDGGAYASFGLVTAYYAGQLLTGPYHFPTYAFDASRVYTNKPTCGPKRGHGSVQPRFAFEVQLDELAEKVGLDPIEIRRRNFIGENVRTVNGQLITSNGFLACLDAVEEASGWKERYGKLPRGQGLGVAGSMYISGTAYPIYPNAMPQAGVLIRIDRSGVIAVHCGSSDIGQGIDSLLAYITAEELGSPLSAIRVFSADTDLCPVDLGAYSSRGTFMVGNACLEACRRLKDQLLAAVSEKWGLEPSAPIGLAGGLAFDLRDTARQMPLTEAFHLAEAKFGSLAATGSYRTEELGGDYRGGTIGASPAYSFTAQVAEVEVDEETGQIAVKHIWIAHDCGKALAPVLVEGQIEGSAYMGAAEAQMEAQVFDQRGLHRAPSLLDYKIPTSLDVPDLDALIVEVIDPKGPYGAKEAGEGPLHPAIPAISNAVHNAVGIRLRATPFTPDRVLAALRTSNKERLR